MSVKREILAAARLYLVLDRAVAGYDRLFDILKQAVPAGVDIVQLRDKQGEAKEIVDFSRRAMRYLRGKVPYVVNDRLDIAQFVGADGVHLGQNDLPIQFARKILGPKAMIGISCQTFAQAQKAQQDGADYLGFGAVFKTPIKPDRVPMNLKLVAQVNARIRIPVFAIGGIDRHNLAQLVSVDVRRIAVIRAICEAKNIAAATRGLKEILMRSQSHNVTKSQGEADR